MAYNVFRGRLFDFDDDLFLSGRFSHTLSGSEMKIRSALLLLFLSLFLWATPAFSQGCAMCRSSAAATSKDGQRAISKGFLLLFLPPVGFMTVGVSLAFLYAPNHNFDNS